ncbi:MAG: hypothetical protein HN509_00535 [Halobacteriovoraceae bacterium]|jgi:hypothetical protein|nr:hypothetical protein [Halobacteriovoraceae bacterium]MBT5094017.1 hypothetical protein [Halobacteriovoraceae bacterium]
MTDKEKSKKDETTKKKVYQKPTIETESLMVFGAVCNGNAKGGRKASTGAPQFCNGNKLNS